MSEKRRDDPSAAHRRTKLALEIVGGAATLATIGTVGHLILRRKQFEDTIDKFTDSLTILERDELSQREAILRRLAAASLVRPEGASPLELKRIAGAKAKHAPGDALAQLVRKHILDVVEMKGNRQVITPNSVFVDAVVTWPDEAPRLIDQATEYDPEFNLAGLLKYTSDSTVARVGTLAASDNS